MKAGELLTWKSLGFLVLGLSPLAGGIPYWFGVDDSGDAAFASWLIIVGTFVGGLLLTGWALSHDPLKALEDGRRRYSLSRLQLVVWSAIIFPGIAALWLAKFDAGASPTAALEFTIPPEVLALAGISVGSFIGSGIVKTGKSDGPTDPGVKVRDEAAALDHAVAADAADAARPDAEAAKEAAKAAVTAAARANATAADKAAAKTAVEAAAEAAARATPPPPPRFTSKGKLAVADAPRLSDMVQAEGGTDPESIDLGKVQMLFVTVVVATAYAVELGDLLRMGGTLSGLPELNEGITGLLLISHAGYLANKQATTK